MFGRKWSRGSILVAIALSLAGCAATPGRVSQTTPIAPINTENGVALKGYDAVAYFADKTARKGSDQITYSWQGLTWKFVSDDNRRLFAAQPAHYAPQYGGYCAFAISRGLIADVDPNSWAVVDDRLYLNNNPFAHEL